MAAKPEKLRICPSRDGSDFRFPEARRRPSGLSTPGDPDLEDGRLCHLLAGQEEIPPFDLFPFFREPPQAVEDQAGQRVIGESLAERDPEMFLHVH